MRFLSAPWVGMLRDGAWLRRAEQANSMAAKLEAELRQLPGVKVMATPRANAVFVQMPPTVEDAMRKRGWQFYTFIGNGGCRLMCAWDTTEEDVKNFVADLKSLL